MSSSSQNSLELEKLAAQYATLEAERCGLLQRMNAAECTKETRHLAALCGRLEVEPLGEPSEDLSVTLADLDGHRIRLLEEMRVSAQGFLDAQLKELKKQKRSVEQKILEIEQQDPSDLVNDALERARGSLNFEVDAKASLQGNVA